MASAGGDPSAGAAAEPAAATPSERTLAACAERVAALIQRRYEGVRDLQARFSQTTRQAGAVPSAPTTSSGTLVFAKPGKMRWSYEQPEPSLVVSDGATLWIYDPGFGEVQRMPVGDGMLSGAAFQFLLGDGDIFRDFRVEARACGEQSVDLELTPREPASYERLGLLVDSRTGDLIRTRLVDLLGTVIEMEISQLQFDRSPSPDLFRFEPPEGVRVTDLEP
ncbi:MAG: outer membrane lipoprotein carrier protein LolA [Myxococcales bacterium]|nr:outer membrane lipoprotein carrier protein LolA [Myxococcales bacterium]MDH5565932.1 outer membrane lipoprotein carrier protein LolA [Myxococcales bacterium]